MKLREEFLLWLLRQALKSGGELVFREIPLALLVNLAKMVVRAGPDDSLLCLKMNDGPNGWRSVYRNEKDFEWYGLGESREHALGYMLWGYLYHDSKLPNAADFKGD